VRIYPSLRMLTFKLCMIFMAILVFFTAVTVSIGVSFKVYKGVSSIADIYEQKFPKANLVEGQLVVEDETPVVYRTKGYLIVMDVTGKQWEREAEFPVAFFFYKDKLVIDTDQTDSREYSYEYFGNGSVTAEAIEAARPLITFFAFVVWTLLLFIDWSFRTALLAMLGSFVVGIVTTYFRVLLPRNEQLKISITAAVPVTVIMMFEHLLLLNEGIGLGITPLPSSLFALNFMIFGLFLVFGSRSYILPYLPKKE